MLVKSLPFGLSLAYVPRGPIGDWQNESTADLLLTELCSLAQSLGAVFLKIEPPVTQDPKLVALLKHYHFRHSHATNQPQSTIMLDLAQGQDGILRHMRKKTRQYIHRAEREGITVRIGSHDEIPAYYELMRLTGRREHFAVRSLAYYETEWETFAANNHAALFLAFYQEQLIAARAVYFFGDHAAEFHAGSITVPGLHPNYLLVWEAMKWAIKNGCKTYDLWGIPDEISDNDTGELPADIARNDGLWGVYQFKRGFSTNVVSYIGAYDHVFQPQLYFLFNTALSWGKWWEQASSLLDVSNFRSPSRQSLETPGGSE